MADGFESARRMTNRGSRRWRTGSPAPRRSSAASLSMPAPLHGSALEQRLELPAALRRGASTADGLHGCRLHPCRLLLPASRATRLPPPPPPPSSVGLPSDAGANCRRMGDGLPTLLETSMFWVTPTVSLLCSKGAFAFEDALHCCGQSNDVLNYLI
jgi:hypothetical protein